VRLLIETPIAANPACESETLKSNSPTAAVRKGIGCSVLGLISIRYLRALTAKAVNKQQDAVPCI
jgi:hypothetical protein